MNTWLANTRDTFRTQLWPVPTIAVVAALVIGLGLPEIDGAVDGDMSAGVSDWLFGGDAEAARALLGAIASSMITVTALTFSLTVVTLQLASSQFSPRLLRTFTSDQFVQATLALFLATFTYALTVLRAVRNAGDRGQAPFVPQLAVTLAFLLAIASVLGLVLFLAHLTAQIRVETMLRNVHRDASRTMRAVLPTRDRPDGDRQIGLRPPSDAVQLLARDDGFLTWIEQNDLVGVAADEGALVSLDVYPGSFLVKGTPLGAVWPAAGGRFTQDTVARVADRVAGCLHTGFERTAAQDVGYGLRQLTDVANKALSPGVNDPTTAIHTLGHISAFLCDLTDHDLGPLVLRDEKGEVRVTLHRPDLAAYLDLGISQPRRYGSTDPQVVEKVFQVLLDLSHRAQRAQGPAIRDQLERLNGTVDAQSFDSVERTALADLGRRVEENLRRAPD